MIPVRHLTLQEMEAGLDEIRQAPRDSGVVKLIVRRPKTDAREVLEEGTLDLVEGLVGDCWFRPHSSNQDSSTQITIMNARVIALVAGDPERWPLAGDQLYLDMDLSIDNLPTGTRLALGEAVLEVSAEPHNGCKKFAARFGTDAVKFVNSPAGKQLHLRGINTRVVRPGAIRVGDAVKKIET